jgi:hypothetical protein
MKERIENKATQKTTQKTFTLRDDLWTSRNGCSLIKLVKLAQSIIFKR